MLGWAGITSTAHEPPSHQQERMWHMQVEFDREVILPRILEFFSIYDITRERTREMCEAKIEHSLHVASNCERIAQGHGFDRYNTDLAWLIGELHDFGRFGQIVVTHSFRDNDRWNHAHLGAKLLFKYGLIDGLVPNWDDVCREDQLVIQKAVNHHSDFHLPDDLTERELMFCRLIQEADQIDIFRTIVESGWETIYSHTKEEILSTGFSDEIVQAFFYHELADYSKRTTYADYHLAHLALCFGLRTRAARERVMEQGYLARMMDIQFAQPEVQETFVKIKAEVNDHLNS